MFIKRNFEPVRLLLRNKNVPFNPDVLLEQDWPERLEPIFNQMPEMQEARYLGEPLRGVQLADTLYLPEHAELAEDAVILAKHLVFEGKDILIKGNHNIGLYPVKDVAILGDMLPRRVRRLSSKRGRSEVIVELPGSRPVSKVGRITIDTSGRGHKEWLDSIGGEEQLSELMQRLRSRDERIRKKAGLEFEMLRHGCHGRSVSPSSMTIQTDCGNTADSGATGPTGPEGAKPDDANPLVQPKGVNGVCGNDINGGRGNMGAPGGQAGDAGQGGMGSPGGNAGGQFCYVPDGDSGVWVFKATGGMGGQGGPGGYAWAGARGGDGGEGGDGADCSCPQGGAGTGGTGGRGGIGGRGGRGGDGGPGGPGGDGGPISVSVPCRWTGSYTDYYSKGGAGLGGNPLAGGGPGAAGSPGKGGKPGTNNNCPTTAGRPGDWGAAGDGGLPGDPGDLGAANTNPGRDGQFTKTERTCPGGGGDCELIDEDGDGLNACVDCDDTCYDPSNQCDPSTCAGSGCYPHTYYEYYLVYPPPPDCYTCYDVWRYDEYVCNGEVMWRTETYEGQECYDYC